MSTRYAQHGVVVAGNDQAAATDPKSSWIRILMLTTSYPAHESDPSGAFIADLAQGIAAAGAQVTVVCPSVAGSTGSDAHGIHVHWVRDPSGITGKGGAIPRLRRRPWRMIGAPLLLYRMWRAARRHARQADVLHAHWLVPSGAIAALCGKPFVVTAHGTDVSLAERWRLLRPWYRAIAGRASQVLAVSDGMRQRLEMIGISANSIAVIRLGIRSKVADHNGSAVRSSDTFVVGFVGSLTTNKSVDMLIRAFARVAEPHWRLEIIGHGPEAGALSRLSGELGVAKATTFQGEMIPELVDRAMERMDVLVLPSRAEGFGLVLAEAIRAGAVVIASDIPGPRELIVDQQTGRLVPSGNIEGLAAALAELAADPALRARLVESARERLQQLGMDQRTSIERHVAVYRTVNEPRGSD